ncbi:MAG TPA: hypothetical protein DCM05_10420 [Elusimicrobia bacterium]|nr:hypothetical protein [Elusimicrobiota bacterium]
MEPLEPLADPKTKRVLIVDDDSNIRSLLEMGAQREGFVTATAEDGAEAAKAIQEFHPDIIITDLMMPQQGGFELIRGLQGTDHGAVPIIIITARRLDESTKEMLRREGSVVQVLTKPLSLNIFAITLHRLLKTQPPASERSRGLNDRF